MDSAFMQFIVQQVGVAGVAFLALYLLNRAYQDSLRREREMNDTLRALNAELTKSLNDNTRAFTENASATREQSRVLESFRAAIGELTHDGRPAVH